ncbi:ABC1 kinase family protein [Leptospira sp. GIMC2001]|uniref:ABC1 kinase family protein n=1 Tax=Leptospira sp. GIMC2001 TaxID=1513297 RepID=UPI00234B29AD|nr:AarF/ABC1/UbiB kinase family protein [Leptospira sp. GIMC2001]WCL48614.1 AarF/ABC1/UbiB kinase family protein [Leptospira sp. GIMC2001]
MSGFFSSGLRIIHSGAIFSTKLGGLAFEILSGNPPLRSVALKLREAFEDLGATYIKLGQFIASAPSIFPTEFVDEMQKCLDQVKPVSIHDIRRIIIKELGEDVHSVFHSFNEVPIASASIAQVHGAITKEGLDVVVKIQRPGIEDLLETDMNLILVLTWILEKFAPKFKSSGLTGMVEEFRKSILEETDFIREAANIEEFENYLLKVGENRAVVPRVYHAYSSKRVLTMERFYGSPITDEVGLRSFTKDPKKVLETALEVWFSSLAQSGFFHADVHAGNLLILKDGKIGFIDFGIVGRISPKVWEGLMMFMQGMSFGEANLVADGLILMDSTEAKIDKQKLVKDLNSVFTEMFSIMEKLQSGNVAAIDDHQLNRIMFDIKEITETNGLKIPREFGLLIKQILYFDRYVQSLAPEINIIRDQKKYISK